MTYSILFVDDNQYGMINFSRALEREGFRVHFETGVDGALAALAKGKVDLAILDIMMPPGRYKDRDHQDGLRTGLILYEDLRKTHPTVPVIILSNILDELELDRDELERGDSNLRLLDKVTCYPSELAEIAKALLSKRP